MPCNVEEKGGSTRKPSVARAAAHHECPRAEQSGLPALQRQLAVCKLLIIDELGYVPLSQTGAELLFEVLSQRYKRGSTIVTSNLPFDEWTSVFGSERLTGALLDRLTHDVHIQEMNGESYRHAHSKRRTRRAKPEMTAGRHPKRTKAPARGGLRAFKTEGILLRPVDGKLLRR
jgi:hypothetical protein